MLFSETSAAVKLALGETQLVTNTRKFLEENGICLDAFNQVKYNSSYLFMYRCEIYGFFYIIFNFKAAKKRSKTVILVKNLPAGTVYEELVQTFQPFGTIARLVIPPHGITALIEFVEPSEAKQAFSKLAYSKFKYLPLYLEWAPDNVFLKPAETQIKSEEKPVKEEKVENPQKSVTDTTKKENTGDESDEDLPEPNTTLFVKGLNFETEENTLKRVFKTKN